MSITWQGQKGRYIINYKQNWSTPYDSSHISFPVLCWNIYIYIITYITYILSIYHIHIYFIFIQQLIPSAYILCAMNMQQWAKQVQSSGRVWEFKRESYHILKSQSGWEYTEKWVWNLRENGIGVAQKRHSKRNDI